MSNIAHSFLIRINTVLYAYQLDNTALMMLQDIASEFNLRHFKNPEWENRISGYVDLVQILSFVIASTLITMPFYLWGFLRLRAWFQDLTTMTAVSMIIVLIIPSMGPHWHSPIYLFMCGFALLPLFVLLQPRCFKRLKRV